MYAYVYVYVYAYAYVYVHVKVCVCVCARARMGRWFGVLTINGQNKVKIMDLMSRLKINQLP